MSMGRYLFASLLVVLASDAQALAHAGVMTGSRNLAFPITVTSANLADVTHVLPTGRRVSPVGTLVGTANFVTQVAWTDGGVAVLANGAGPVQDLTYYSAADLHRSAVLHAVKTRADSGSAYGPASGDRGNTSATSVFSQDLFQGLIAGPHGRLYATGGAAGDVLALQLGHGRLRLLRRYPLRWQTFPTNQYPYEYQGEQDQPRHFYPDSVTLGPAARHLYVTGLLANSLARIDLRTGYADYLNIGPYPFAVILADAGKKLVVSEWGGNGVAVVDRRTFRLLGRVATGPSPGPDAMAPGVHPTALAAVPGSPDVWVADSNVDRLVELDTERLRVIRTLDDSPYPHAPPGSYPDALAVAKGRLFVANAGNNDVALFDLRTGKLSGLIPTGWYPTALTLHDDNLYVISAKGLGSGPNIRHQWVGDMMHGLLQKVPLAEMNAELPAWTQRALADDRFSAPQRKARHARDQRTTAWLHRHIRYVVFILRENKTFDEDFGAYPAAGRWADPHLDLYNARELPNLYHLARGSTLFADFMADGEVTAQGHQWTTGASDSDFVQRTWTAYYSGRGLVENPGWTQSLVPGRSSAWGGMPLGVANPYAIYLNLSALGHWSNPWIAYPARLYLFNDLLEHQVSFEDFGEFVSRSKLGDISPQMQPHLAVDFPGWDRLLLDTQRARLAIDWLKAHPGRFPHFIYIWLPDDHTAGNKPCYYTPDYYVADNDAATARFVHYLSTTPQWKHMVVFLTEDDAQSGADHINAHRTFALALGPWIRRGLIEKHRYSQVNLLKTSEAILGLPPMSQWDDTAAVLAGIWTDTPHFAPTEVKPMQVPVAFNPGRCSRHTRLRREAGATGHILTVRWLKQRAGRRGKNPAGAGAPQSYTPTALLKVPGPEQMRQEWIASKGLRSYAAVMAYLRQLARRHHAPVNYYLANERN